MRGPRAWRRRTGAGLVVFGSLIGLAGDSLRVDATVFDAGTRRPLGDVEIGGAANRMDVVVDSLTRELLRLIGRTRRIGSTRMTGIGSRSVPALKAFLQGEQFRRNTSWDSAQARYEEAVALDSTFALAWLRLGETYALTRFPVPLPSGPQSDNPWYTIYRAGTLNRGLPPHDSLMVEASAGVAAFVLRKVTGDPDSVATRVYQAALAMTRLYPKDPEAWYVQAIVQDFLGGYVNTTVRQTYESYSRAISLDSAFAPAYRMALRVSGDVGDVEGTRRLAERYLTLNPSPASRIIPSIITRLLDPRADTLEAQQALDSAPAAHLWPTLTAIWLLPDSQESAIRIARESYSREHDPRYWFTAEFIMRRNLAAVLAYRGHMREALALAGTEQDSWFPNLLAELAVYGAVPAAVADSAFSDWLAHPTEINQRQLPYARWWWAVRRDTMALKRFLTRVPGERSLAFLAMARRDTAGALRHLTAWREDGYNDWFGTILLVRLLAAAGEVPRALAILNGREPNDWPLPSHVVWTLERARLAELAGQREAAARDYRFVAEVWVHADPEFQPFVAEARAGLGRLRGGDRSDAADAPVRERIGFPQAPLQ